MSLTSMKLPDNNTNQAIPDNPYGYGLCISLTEEQVEALGLNANPPRAGSEVGLRAIATVRRVTQQVDADDSKKEEGKQGGESGIDVVLELQITDLEVTPGGGMQSQPSMLYGG